MQDFFSIIILVIVLGLMVFVHELGHFLAAKAMKITVEEFAFGFGAAIWKRKINGTLYRINWAPLGGYVKMQDEGLFGNTKSADSYVSKSLPAKLLVLFAGIAMNILLAVVLFAIYLASSSYQVALLQISDYQFVGADVKTILPVSNVQETSPAAGKLTTEDVIVQVNGADLTSSAAFRQLLIDNQGQAITIGYVKLNNLNAEPTTITLTLPVVAEGQPVLGVGYFPSYLLTYPASIASAVPQTINAFGYQVSGIVSLVNQSVEKSDITILANEFVGVIGIRDLIGSVLAVGDLTVLINLTAILSLALAMFNILPFPLLDGGQAVLEVLQSISGRRIPEAVISALNLFGLIVLGLLFLWVTFKDISQTDLLGGIISSIQNALGR